MCFLVTTIIASCGAAPAPPGPTSKAAFVTEIKRGYTNKNIDVLARLCYTEGITGHDLQNFLSILSDDFDYTVKDVRILPLDDSVPLEYTRNGKTYRPNLPPIGKVEILFEGNNNQTTSFLVGVKDAVYYIVLATSVSN